LAKKTEERAQRRSSPAARRSDVHAVIRAVGPLIDAIGPCVLVVDREGRCVLANRASAEALAHEDPRCLVGKRVTGRVAEAITAGHTAHFVDETMVRADGGELLVECWVRPTKEGRAITGAVVSFVERGRVSAATLARTSGSLDGLRSAAPASRRRASHALQGRSVLVVDNDEGARAIVTTMLEQYGAQVRAAESAAEAMRVLEVLLPDVIVSDISMPVEDGYSFMRRLRTSPDARRARLAAIALTALGRPEDRANALDAGFELHLVKPVDPEDLFRAVASLIPGVRKDPRTGK
jgi:CheY-like chemotaxis protein